MNPIRSAADRAWVILFLATGLTWWIGDRSPDGSLGSATVLLVFALACVKGWLVIDVFMGLREAPSRWRWAVRGWLLAVAALIVLAYWLPG